MVPLEIETRIRAVTASMAYYDEQLDRERVVDLAGRHLPAVEAAVTKTISWGRDPEKYLKRVFDAVPEGRADDPALVVLPRNDRGDLAPYVLSQCLLAGCPAVVRPSSREAGEYVARTYYECLMAAIRDVADDEAAEAAVSAFDLLDPEEARSSSDIASAASERVQLLLFGDDETLAELEAELAARGTEVSNSIRMGTGRSSSVLVDADAESLDAYCRAVARSAVFDKGDDCTSTSVLYVVGEFEFYEDALDSLSAIRSELAAGDDFAAPATPQVEAARERLGATHPGTTLSPDRLNLVECTATAPVGEFPIPVVQVKRAENCDDLLDLMRSDFADRESLVTSVFTDDSETVGRLAPELPTTLVKHNRPTHDVDLLEPHHGTYLVADLL